MNNTLTINYYKLHQHLSDAERKEIDSWPVPEEHQVFAVRKIFCTQYKNPTIEDILDPSFAMWAKLFIKCYETRSEYFI